MMVLASLLKEDEEIEWSLALRGKGVHLSFSSDAVPQQNLFNLETVDGVNGSLFAKTVGGGSWQWCRPAFGGLGCLCRWSGVGGCVGLGTGWLVARGWLQSEDGIAFYRFSHRSSHLGRLYLRIESLLKNLLDFSVNRLLPPHPCLSNSLSRRYLDFLLSLSLLKPLYRSLP